MVKLLTALALFIIALPSYADGGGPLLLIVNFMLFTYGQAWILLIETFAFHKIFSQAKIKIVFKWVLFANLASTFIGALLVPLVWAAIFAALGQSLWDNEIGKTLYAIGTWILGDNSPHPNIAIGVSIAGFIVTYFLTVYIERWVFMKAIDKNQLPKIENLLKHCYIINGVSYAGLIGLFFYFSEF